MHDYTAWQVHDDRMRELTREADATRLAAIAKEGRPRRDPRTKLRRWMAFGLSRLSLEAWQPGSNENAVRPDPGAATTLSVSSTGDR
jgi:hypothetical protein